jgi:cytochrome P450
MTIYHRLMDESASRTGTVPSAGSLYEEAQALMFAGGDTTGMTLMVATYHLLRTPDTFAKLKEELLMVWPLLGGKEPEARELEKLPYLTAVIKEALRLMSGVVSGLLRIVPVEGARIAGVDVPGGVSDTCLFLI